MGICELKIGDRRESQICGHLCNLWENTKSKSTFYEKEIKLQKKNLCLSVQSVGRKNINLWDIKEQRRNLRHLRNLRDLTSRTAQVQKSVFICAICGT